MRSPSDRARKNAQALILSKMILAIFQAAFEGYWQGYPVVKRRNMANNLSEWLVSMAIRVNGENHDGATPVARIARMLGMPRSTVARWAQQLAMHGVVTKANGEDGYITDDTYVDGRAHIFDRMITAVLVAADELRLLQ